MKLEIKSKPVGHDMEYDVHIVGKYEDIRNALKLLMTEYP